MATRISPDVKALANACAWIERSSSERMIRAAAVFIYDRYVVHPRPATPEAKKKVREVAA